MICVPNLLLDTNLLPSPGCSYKISLKYSTGAKKLEQEIKGNISYRRLLTLFWVTVYIVSFVTIYVNWASVNFYYFGFWYNHNPDNLALAYVIIALFAILLPVSVTRYSDFACWILYFIIFIPSVLIVSMQGYETFSPTGLNVSLAASFFLMLYIPRKINFKSYSIPRRIQTDAFFFFFFAFYLAAMAFYLITYGEMLSFSGLDEIYDQRARFSNMDTSAIALYLTGWLSNAMNPYLLAVGLFDRTRRWLIPVGIAGQIIVFMAFAGKMMLVILLVTAGFYFFVLKNGRVSTTRLAFGFAMLTLCALAILAVTNYHPDGLSLDIVALIFMRTLGIQGAMTGVYADIFSNSPLTYWSHANIINQIVDYPYKVPLGFVVGTRLVGGSGFNANANFWATDGVAAYGMMGVVIMGAVFGFLLSLANKVITPDRLPFATIVSIPFLMTMGNASLFTSLITGGGLMTVAMIAYGMPQRRRAGKPSMPNEGHIRPALAHRSGHQRG